MQTHLKKQNLLEKAVSEKKDLFLVHDRLSSVVFLKSEEIYL